MERARRPCEIFHLRQDKVSQRGGVSDERVGGCEALHRRVEPRERLVRDARRNLRAVAPGARVLVATSTRLVFCTDRAIASQSTGERLRRSMTSARTPSRSSSSFAATSARCTTAPYVTTVRSRPSLTTLALPKGIMKFGPGLGALL